MISPENIATARTQGFSDEEIIELISQESAPLASRIQKARENDFTNSEIVDLFSQENIQIPRMNQTQQEDQEISREEQEEPPGAFGSLVDLGAFGAVPAYVSELMKGSNDGVGPIQSWLNAVASGTIKGFEGIGSLLGNPVLQEAPNQLIGREEFKEIQRGERDPELITPTGLFVDPAETRADIEETFPTDEGFISNVIERGSELGVGVGAGGGGFGPAFLRGTAAAIAGQTARAAGLGETGESVAEFVTLVSPSFVKRNLARPDQKELVEFLREKGLSEQQIAPALTSESLFSRFLSKISKKGQKTQTILKDSRETIGEIYNDLKATPEAQTTLTFQQGEGLIERIGAKLRDLPSKVRNKITQDFREFRASPRSGEDIINFWQDINATAKGDAKALSAIKPFLSEALKDISPELFNDFQLTNQAYGNVANIAAKLKPSLAEKLFGIGELGSFLFGLTTGNVPLMGKVVGMDASRRIAKNLLLNPRFNNLQLRFVEALNSSKFALAADLQSEMRELMVKIAPQAAFLLDVFDPREFEEQD